ncbi:MAG: hypothetical protein NVSMB57_08010 [Actinomycetota bacterium]
MVIVAAYGRGAYIYRFGSSPPFVKHVEIEPPFLNKLVAGPFGFETNEEGWAAAAGSTSSWRRQPPGDSSGFSMQVVPYTDSQSTSLISPKMTLPKTSTVQVNWSERRDTEPCCDALSLFWSSDGKTWKGPVYSEAGQNPAFPNFSSVSARFVAPKGGLYVKFSLASDTSVSSPPYTGVAVDNISIYR